MARRRIAILLDIDGTLIVSGGAGATSWRLAFDELYGIPADIGEFTDTGMTDPEVGRKTFEAVLGRPPAADEFARLLERRQHYLYDAVEESEQPELTEEESLEHVWQLTELLLWLADQVQKHVVGAVNRNETSHKEAGQWVQQVITTRYPYAVEHITDDPTRLLHELTGEAMARGEQLDDLEVSRPTLEEVYLELTADV